LNSDCISSSMINFAVSHQSFLQELKKDPSLSYSIPPNLLDEPNYNNITSSLQILFINALAPFVYQESQKRKDIMYVMEQIKCHHFTSAATYVKSKEKMRTSEVLSLFVNAGKEALKLYFNVMLKGSEKPLNKFESLVLVKLVLSDDPKNMLILVALWLEQDKLTLSEEIADFIKSYDISLALNCYSSLPIPDKVIDCFKELKDYRKMILYAKVFGHINYLEMIKDLHKSSPQNALNLAIALAETPDGSPVNLQQVCSILQISIPENEWNFSKLFKQELKKFEN